MVNGQDTGSHSCWGSGGRDDGGGGSDVTGNSEPNAGVNGDEVGCCGDPCGCCGDSGRGREDDDMKGDFESVFVQDDLDDDDSNLNTF